MKVFKNIMLCVAVAVVTILLSIPFGKLYLLLFPQHGESLFLSSALLDDLFSGIYWSYIFSLTFLFTAFGGKKKYWWVGILLLPVLWFVVKFDLAHWYFYVGLAVAGLIIGWLLSKLISTFRK